MTLNIRNYNIKDILKGKYKKISTCEGPLKNYRGTERPCCLYCSMVRNLMSYETKNFLYFTNPNLLFYLDNVSVFIEEVYTAFSISVCNEKTPVIVYQPGGKLELDFTSYHKSFFKQIKFLHKQGVLIKNYDIDNFTLTERSIPIFVPDFGNNDRIDIRSSYGGDEGVEFKKVVNQDVTYHLFRVTDQEASWESGRWTHLAKYFEIMTNIFGIGKRITKKVHHSDNTFSIYYIIPQDFIDENEIFYLNKFNLINQTIEDKKLEGLSSDKYAVIDLDSTLIFSSGYDITIPTEKNDRIFYIKLISQKIHYKVCVRKHVLKFLKDLEFLGFKLIIWSAGWRDYVDRIVSEIFKDIDITYVLDRAYIGENEYKDLNIIGKFIENFDINNSVLIDDKELHRKNQEKHVITIPAFKFKGSFPTEEEDDDVLETFAEKVNETFKNK